MDDPLRKTIARGSCRWIGQRTEGVCVADVPIAGKSVGSIAGHRGGVVYRIGRVDIANAFVLDRAPLRLLYVRPKYSGYRLVARRVFPNTQWSVDFDHALGRKMADQIGMEYVLLIRLTPRINRSHGRFERVYQPGGEGNELCFPDRRILDKWIGRVPKLWSDSDRLQPYHPDHRLSFGLSLKQAGKWGFAMGLEDDHIPIELLPSLVRAS